MTTNELNSFIKTELQGCNGYAFIDRALDDLTTLIRQRKEFNINKFVEWFKSKSVATKTYPISFLTKCGFDDIKRGLFDNDDTFVNDKERFCIQLLFNQLRDNGIEVIQFDTTYIDHVEDFILKNGLMTVNELINWNNKAVRYLANQGKTTQDFIYLFKNTRDMRALNLPFAQLEKEIHQLNEQWKELIKMLDEIEPTEPTAIGIEESETNNNEKNN